MTLPILHIPSLLAAGSLDFDITLVFQFVIFMATLIMMHTLLIKPYLQVREAREEGTQGSREDADEMHERAEQLLTRYDEQLADARRNAVGVRDSLRGQGIAEQDDLLDEVRAEITTKLADERGKIAESVTSAEAQIEERARKIAEVMVQRVLPELEA